MNAETAWNAFTDHVGQVESLTNAIGLLEWDQQTHMPQGGAALRGGSLAVLSALRHEKLTKPAFGDLLSTLESADLDVVKAAGVRNYRREYDRAVKVPDKLVTAQAEARARAFQTWVKAKQDDDFQAFLPALQEVMALTKEEADHIRRPEHACRHDALLDIFDPGTTVAELAPMFERLGGELNTFLDALEGTEGPAYLSDSFDADGQWALSQELVGKLGYDLGRGRLDRSEHPFTIGMGAGDVRITTHLYDSDLLSGLGGTIHETGHALYEQGLRQDQAGWGTNHAAGCGIHESQSRLWENFIGRSLPFCRFLAPMLAKHFPDKGVSAEQLYGANNRLARTLLRVQADEATYNLHIIVRFQLERALFDGDLQVADLEGAWADLYDQVVGIRPPSAATGVLQDVHWASGAIGYFPSYTIGNLYAASLGCALEAALPELWNQVERGEFQPILSWLREQIHVRGHEQDAPDILRAAVGERDMVDDLMNHLWGRQGALYGVSR